MIFYNFSGGMESAAADDAKERPLFQCSCFGGNESVWDGEDA